MAGAFGFLAVWLGANHCFFGRLGMCCLRLHGFAIERTSYGIGSVAVLLAVTLFFFLRSQPTLRGRVDLS